MTPEQKKHIVDQMIKSLKEHVDDFRNFNNPVEKYLFTVACALRMEFEDVKEELAALYRRIEEIRKNDYRHGRN